MLVIFMTVIGFLVYHYLEVNWDKRQQFKEEDFK